MNQIVGSHNILMMTLDTLRFDVAEEALLSQQTPTLARWLGNAGWERRHSPANFTYAAHHAFFAGFLPTSNDPANQTRLFATAFPGSETTGESTCVFEEANIVEGLANRGYETHCVGGVGFFNKMTALGSVLPGLFQHSYWEDDLGVTCPESATNQVKLAKRIIRESPAEQRLFLFVNISAMHQPNHFYLPEAKQDSRESQTAALANVDLALESMFDTLQSRAPWFVILCSDHGTAYGEEGRTGHRWNHPVIGDVPYADFVVPAS